MRFVNCHNVNKTFFVIMVEFMWYFLLQIYDESEMLKGKLDLLSNTNMVDFAMDVYQNLYPDQEVPQSMD